MSTDTSQNGNVEEKLSDKVSHYHHFNQPQGHHNAPVFAPHHLEKLCSALENHNTIARKLTSTTAIGKHSYQRWLSFDITLTTVGLGGFVLCTTPLSMVLLGFQSASGIGAANLYVVEPPQSLIPRY